MPRLRRSEATSARRWARVESTCACALRALARSAEPSDSPARARASRSLPAVMAAWPRLRAVRARSSSCGAHCWASAASARATASRAAESSAVGGGRVAQPASATARTRHAPCRRIWKCAKLVRIRGPPRGKGTHGHCQQHPPGSQTSGAARQGNPTMDIGYFLKLMTEKNASDMFLTTGAPVYIKVEGKLYPLGNTGLPPGMVKKIAY